MTRAFTNTQSLVLHSNINLLIFFSEAQNMDSGFFSFHNNYYYSLVLLYLQSTSLQQTSLSDTHLRTRNLNYFSHHGLVASSSARLTTIWIDGEADVWNAIRERSVSDSSPSRISARTLRLDRNTDPRVLFNCKGLFVTRTRKTSEGLV